MDGFLASDAGTVMKKQKRIAKRKKDSAVLARRDYTLPERIEQALMEGNLKNLTPEERVKLVTATCRSLRLNPLTKPFIYILIEDFGGEEKLILYASRNCTDQLRTIRGVTVIPGTLKQWRDESFLRAQVAVMDRTGRTDEDLASIPLMRYSRKHQREFLLTGRDLANAEMHVVTKAKRRATLSLCGLGGIVDESELDTMNVIGGVTPEGRVFRYPEPKLPRPRMTREEIVEAKNSGNWCEKHGCDMNKCPSDEHTQAENEAWFERQERAKKFAADRLQAAPQNVPTGGQVAKPQPSVQHVSSAAGKPSPGMASDPAAPLSKSTIAANSKPPVKRDGAGSRVSEGAAANVPTGAQDSKLNFKPPQARIPVKVKAVKWTKNSKGLELELDTGKRLYCFDNKRMGEDREELFNILLVAAGKECIFLTKNSKSGDSREFTNIVGLLKMGEREWGEDGVPILRREPAMSQTERREPGDEPEEEWLK